MAAVASSSRAFLPVLLVLLLIAVATPSAAGARLTTTADAPAGLAELLTGDGSQQYCWQSLMDIRSCTGEIILFFLNGEAYLGPGCCRAIRVIENRCWAADAMLSVIGFTPEEGDMLKGYCDAGDDGDNGEGHHRPIGGSQPAPPPTNPALDGVATTGGGSTAPTAAAAAAAAAAGRKGMVAVRHQLDG